MASTIRVEDLTKRYPTGRVALNHVSLTFNSGEVTAVLGPSGAGKSTLLRCINGFETPSHGSVKLNDLIVNEKSYREVRQKVGMVFQHFNLVPRLNALTNVATGRLGKIPWFLSLFYLFPKSDLELAASALDRVGLSQMAWQRVDRLSGGQQQRVAIARSLVQNPDFILADEPVASLDPVTSAEVLGLLVEAARKDGIGLVVNLHQVDLALQFCDRIIGLRDGKLVFDRPAKELDPKILDNLYEKVSN